jgi:Rrf2 family transcriptional regulator, nitric oxide-sensitive transcriptional repressor
MYVLCIFWQSVMKLTTQTDYALRVLMYLATRDERAHVADVARLFGISVHHVAKVVNQLARYGYVRSIRGIGGGIELARSPAEIRLGEVVERFEGSLHLLDCIGTEDVCAIQAFCKLKGVLAEAERVQLEYLNSVTLDQVVPTRRQLRPFES